MVDPLEHVMFELQSEANRLDTCAHEARSAEGAAIFRAQSAIVRRLLATFTGAHSNSDRDERYALITVLDNEAAVSLHFGLVPLQEAIERFRAEHRDTMEDRDVPIEWHRLIVPRKGTAAPEEGCHGTTADVRHAFVSELYGDLSVTLHNTKAEREAAVRAFMSEHEGPYEEGEAFVYYHETTVPPRAAATRVRRRASVQDRLRSLCGSS